MKKLFLMCALMLAHSAFANYTPDTLLVKLKTGESFPQSAEIQKIENLFDRVYAVKTKNLLKTEALLKKSGRFEYINKNRISKHKMPKINLGKSLDYPMFATPFNDPYVSKIWSFLDAKEFGVSVNLAYNQFAQAPRKEIIVAVVDTGVEYNHEDLKNIMWKNPGEIAANGIDDDNNGYVDDIYGINTINRDSEGRATGNMMDGHGHGTHVSGTIAAEQNNNVGIAGIASNVKIMGIRTVPNNGDETDRNVVESFIYAAKHGAKLINCSFGKRENEDGMAVSDAIKFVGENYGVLVVAAAGNDSLNLDNSPHYPAAFKNDHLLVVASTASSGSLSSFSNYGPKSVDLAAPGSSIYSTFKGNRYASLSGTSMATPTTVGVAAEVLAQYPDLGALELKKLLMDTISPVSSFKGRMMAPGRVDLVNALKKARGTF